MKNIILVYHGIGNKDKFMEVEYQKFIQQIDYLIKKKYDFCHVSEILERKIGKNICIMFDDGLASSYKAIKFLEDSSLKYSLAIVENYIGKEGYLSLENILKLKHAEICFHTKNHVDLTKINIEILNSEITIKNDFFNKEIIVYPKGIYNDTVISSIKNKGYKYGLTVLPFHISKNQSNYIVPRICINGFQSFLKYKFFLTIVGNLYLHIAFIKRKIFNQSYLER